MGAPRLPPAWRDNQSIESRKLFRKEVVLTPMRTTFLSVWDMTLRRSILDWDLIQCKADIKSGANIVTCEIGKGGCDWARTLRDER